MAKFKFAALVALVAVTALLLTPQLSEAQRRGGRGGLLKRALLALAWSAGGERRQPTILATAGNLQDATGLSSPNERGKLGDRRLHYTSPLGRVGNEVPSKCATFFWMSMIASA